jgi:hypothetical protein
MGNVYRDPPAKVPPGPRGVDLIEGAMLLAFFLVALTALIGKLHQMLG